MREVIVRLEKQYNIDIDDFLELYKNNIPREEISKILNIGVHKVKTIAASLGLRMAKKYREGDYKILEPKLQSTDYVDEEVIEDLVDDVDVLSGHLYKTNKSLVNCRDQNNVLRKQIREMARCEEMESRIVTSLKENLEELSFELPKKSNKNTIKDNFNDLCLMCLSDLHVGNLTESADVGGLNQYNFDTFEKRLDKMFKEVRKSKATKLHIVILGDILQGVIHNNDLIGEQPTVKALVDFVKIFTEKVTSIFYDFQEIEVTLTNGNHSRLQEKPVYHKKTFDFDYIIYEFLKKMLMVEVNYDRSGYNLIELPNKKYAFAFHGDTLRKYNPLNISEVIKATELCRQIFNKEPQLLLSGHFHQYCSTLLPNGGKAISVGTMMGMDSYAFNSGFVNTPPSQVILEYNNLGECICERVITFSDIT
jgi:hypothetical protein